MKNVYEVFEEFEKSVDRHAKLCVLRYNASYALKNVLRGTFSPYVNFTIDRVPLYKPSDSPPGLGYTTIHQELGRTYIFEKDNPRVDKNLTQERKEQILIQILETLEKREAEVFMNMLLKKQKVKGLTEDIVKEAFPDLY